MLNNKLSNNALGFVIMRSDKITIKDNNIEKSAIGILHQNSQSLILENNIFNDVQENIRENTAGETSQLDNVAEEIRQEPEKIIDEIEIPSNEDILKQSFKLKFSNYTEEELSNYVNDIIANFLSITDENLIINRTFEFNENSTIVTLTLTPKKIIHDLSLYEFMPKCFANLVSEIEFSDYNFEVIAKDPLIVWSFPVISEKNILSYQTDKKITEECKDIFKSLGIAVKFDDFNKKTSKSNILFSLLIILVIIAAVIYFKRKKR